MTDDLAEIKERLNNCEKDFEAFRKAVDRYLKGAIQTRIKKDADTKTYFVRLKQPIPVSIVVTCGNLIHEMRSCLDSLACVLAERHSRSHKNTYFPISKTEEGWRTEGQKKMKLLSPVDQALIEQTRPWGGENGILFAMHEYDRRRKHIRLNVATASVHGFQMSKLKKDQHFTKFYMIDAFNVDLSTDDWQRTLITSADSQGGHPNGRMHFQEPVDLKGAPALENMGAMLATVRGIVSLFQTA